MIVPEPAQDERWDLAEISLHRGLIAQRVPVGCVPPMRPVRRSGCVQVDPFILEASRQPEGNESFFDFHTDEPSRPRVFRWSRSRPASRVGAVRHRVRQLDSAVRRCRRGVAVGRPRRDLRTAGAERRRQDVGDPGVDDDPTDRRRFGVRGRLFAGTTEPGASEIGVLPESTGYPGSQWATAYLRFYGQLFGLDRSAAELRGRRLLEQFGLADRPGRIASFSRGMRQRLGMCRALMSSPMVLFLDEPTLGLDPVGKDEMLDELARIAVEDGTCVILCSHLLDEVERVCDRIGIMHEGRKVAEGTLDEVVATAGIAGFGTIRVAVEDISAAADALRGSSAVADVGFDNAKPGDPRLAVRCCAGVVVRAGWRNRGRPNRRNVDGPDRTGESVGRARQQSWSDGDRDEHIR